MAIVGIVTCGEIFVSIIDDGGGGGVAVVVIDINDGLSLVVGDDDGGFVHSLLSLASSTHSSTCETYRLKSMKDSSINVFNFQIYILKLTQW